MKHRKVITLNQSKDTLTMVGYLQWNVVVLSVIQTEKDKLVKYHDFKRKYPPHTCAG